MSITVEPVKVEVMRWQSDALGYTRCGDHIAADSGGHRYEQQARDVLRSSECDDAGLWTCDTCRRYVTNWPRVTITVNATVEHTPCRIF